MAFIDFIKTLFFGTEQPASPACDEDIPRYPPFMKGLPAAPVDRVVATQVELMGAIEDALALPEEHYRTIAAPVIARYAAFTHLLPASESHHHRGAGGLFRHGLEVAFGAARSAQGCLFATGATPKERKALEPRWRLAVCLAGLLHDIGKPVSDMAVVDRGGENIWNPCDENLTEWAEQNGIDRYFLRWRENRHKRHEQFSALVIERVLTKACRSYILRPGPDVMQAMLETIQGLDRGSKIYELVMEADRKSVERDLKAHFNPSDSAMGIPVEKYLFDAMRRLVKSGRWTANEKGARVWRFREGLHVVWRTGAQEIVETLARDKVPGIPRDEDTLADILIERGLAMPRNLPDGRTYRYWRMQPTELDSSLYLLRLASPELIYAGEPPVVVGGSVVDEEASGLSTLTASAPPKGASARQARVANSQGKTSKEAGNTVESSPVARDALRNPPGTIESKASPSGRDGFETPQMPSPGSHAQNHPSLTIPKWGADDRNSLRDMNASAPLRFLDEKGRFAQVAIDTGERMFEEAPAERKEGLTDDFNPQAPRVENESEHLGTEQAGRWLLRQGPAGDCLIRMAEAITHGQWKMGVDVSLVEGKLLLPYPETARKLNLEPKALLRLLDDKGWLVTDILSPMRKVREVGNVRGVLLSLEPSRIWLEWIESGAGDAKDAKPHPVIPPEPPKPASKTARTSAAFESKSRSGEKTKEQKRAPPPRPTGKTAKPAVPGARIHPVIQSTENDCPDTGSRGNAPPAVNPSVPSLQGEQTQAGPVLEAFVGSIRAGAAFSGSITKTDDGWIVPDAILDECLQRHPGLSRSAFLREISGHPDCEIRDGQLRIKSGP